MTLGSLVILGSIVLAAGIFWRLRGISENSILVAKQYCQKHHLQFISLARLRTRLSIKYGRPDWLVEYALEFSSNGEDTYNGTLTCIGRRVVSIDLPVYKID